MKLRHFDIGCSRWLLHRKWRVAGGVVSAVAAGLCVQTVVDLQPLPASLEALIGAAQATQVLDRTGVPLNVTYENAWNVHDVIELHDIPAFLRLAFIHAEDKRFHSHDGPDWLARLSALATNVRAGRPVRGASTISEQTVRMLHPRPRTLWSRWLEGFEASRLEQRFSKDAILEFYLNQVPYASNRRGVAQAASYYFSRDLSTLSPKEMLTLAVLIRSPSRLDPYRSGAASHDAVVRLAGLMVERGVLTPEARDAALAEALPLEPPQLDVAAPHFVQWVEARLHGAASHSPRTVTTLDAGLQHTVQGLLDQRLAALAGRQVAHGAVLVVDNASGGILAWVVAGGGDEDGPRTYIDAVTTPRQPGSALKPFLYALALESGWTAAQIIEDAPLATDIGAGLHRYANFSGHFYGPVTLRDALGSSLNIPALETLRFVGAGPYLDVLRTLGFQGLDAHPDVYGDGIALGNGEVSLYELVQAYMALANRGSYRSLSWRLQGGGGGARAEAAVFSPEAASLIADILSDPSARMLEFGRHNVLNLPVQTAVKTGTSSDFRDAWAVGFNAHFTVGVWMGNLDRRPTQGVTGSIGPALLLRSVFAELTRHRPSQVLYLSPRLAQANVCVPVPASGAGACLERADWFMPGSLPAAQLSAARPPQPIRMTQPTPGLELAVDPRLPPQRQAFEFVLDGLEPGDEVRWSIDGVVRRTVGVNLVWPLERGRHRVQASVRRQGESVAELANIEFTVK